MGILAAMTVAMRAVIVGILLAGGLSAALARPLTAHEETVLRAAPPYGEQNRTPAHLERFRAAAALARKRSRCAGVRFCSP